MKIAFGEATLRPKSFGDLKIYVDGTGGEGFNALVVILGAGKKHPRKKVIGPARLYFVISGCGNFFIDGKTYVAQARDLFVIKPGQEYSYEAGATGSLQLFEVNIASAEGSFDDELVEPAGEEE